MKTLYKISSEEIGTILLRRRKIAKALRWWLRDNGINYTYTYFSVDSDYKNVPMKKHLLESNRV